ncbi:putative DNA glycosylase [Colletotrichum spinosum]|uniref:Putative DNA glycosylase n=1 Tax=Colletotrichum spinosum TaxID=1347390 RepID=A0A4R8Q7C4_9PEZI|nr:putative DNA glycosylase [Colletotrichum spinosum]
MQEFETYDVDREVPKRRKRVPRRTKDNPYGLMPGRTPYPDRQTPTPEECQEVHDILTELHGEFKSPDKIPPPSTEVAGCGEVPDLVDAMIRTLISGHTSMANANKAIQDVIARFGLLDKDGIGAGSIDWNKARLASEEDVMWAIKRAGLGYTKSREIKQILDMVYEENQFRRREILKEEETGEPGDYIGASELTQGQKDHQLLKIESNILTLDHIRGMTTDEAMLEFTKYPGIGIKTASCLVLFCLQQPSFAVDTHVWRMCKWLGWVPPKSSRDDTYMHCELRIPDHLKYGLHQLFIHHGKSCGRCRGNTREGSVEWYNTDCPLEHLLNRFDKRQAKVIPKKVLGKRKRLHAVQLESYLDDEAIREEDRGESGYDADEESHGEPSNREMRNLKRDHSGNKMILTLHSQRPRRMKADEERSVSDTTADTEESRPFNDEMLDVESVSSTDELTLMENDESLHGTKVVTAKEGKATGIPKESNNAAVNISRKRAPSVDKYVFELRQGRKAEKPMSE